MFNSQVEIRPKIIYSSRLFYPGVNITFNVCSGFLNVCSICYKLNDLVTGGDFARAVSSIFVWRSLKELMTRKKILLFHNVEDKLRIIINRGLLNKNNDNIFCLISQYFYQRSFKKYSKYYHIIFYSKIKSHLTKKNENRHILIDIWTKMKKSCFV